MGLAVVNRLDRAGYRVWPCLVVCDHERHLWELADEAIAVDASAWNSQRSYPQVAQRRTKLLAALTSISAG